MNAFDHYTPHSLPEALELLNRLNGQAQVIAGGSDLMIKLKKGLAAPAAVINIKHLPELKEITYVDETGLRLGALTTLGELTRSALIRQHYPCLAKTAGLMASRQIRNFATVGGNLCNASPSADSAPPLIAYGATVRLIGPHGERELPLEDFFRGPGQTALAPGELLQRIEVPPPDGEAIYIKHVPRAFMDIAVVGVCVRLTLANKRCQAIRLVLAAVAPVPLRAKQAEQILLGQPLTANRIAQAARLAAEESLPIDDAGGSAWYRRRMVEVETQRGLQTLAESSNSL
jgi:carbon-monoxide dehydrogenase medium subunit